MTSAIRDVQELLRREHPSLADDPNPLKTVMQFGEGRYFLPAFYALRSLSESVAAEMRGVLDRAFRPLLDALLASDRGPTGVTLRTLHFCADHLRSRRFESFGEMLRSIVKENGPALLAVETRNGLVRLVRKMQERHLPVRVLKSALNKKPSRFVWNPLSGTWQEGGIADHVQNLWSHVRAFYDERGRGPDEDVLNAFRVPAVVASVLSDATMERRDVRMDAHAWFLRLGDGSVLDLPTGHVGAAVPEFYLSDRKIEIPSGLFSAELGHLYRLLTDREFFDLYRKVASLDVRESLVDTLVPLVTPNLAAGDLAESVMHFYVNLCKCTCFDYELMMYLLDVLASVLVGTNYERKFFVWKGRTRNGKSKLFEVMGRALGGYYRCVQSENLTPGRSAGSTTPELASTLFSCRMVTIEELGTRLDENRVKQIAGDSAVSFRNLYEQSSGGVPAAKVFATTNHRPECRASEAFKERVVAIPFEAEFADDAPARPSQQLARNKFPRESRVVERSYRGCFFVLYHHYRQHADPADGLLHYRKEPRRVVEYTKDFLAGADVYVQFKIFMDVQLRPGSRTTAAEVRSAVRRYLTATKSTCESDLLACFEEEFGRLRQVRPRDDCEGEVVYSGIVIRNLKQKRR